MPARPGEGDSTNGICQQEFFRTLPQKWLDLRPEEGLHGFPDQFPVPQAGKDFRKCKQHFPLNLLRELMLI